MEDVTGWPDFQTALFDQHPYPMWIYELGSLKFLAVNNSAIDYYGYSRETFLGKTLRDIRPQEDWPALQANVIAADETAHDISVWRHRLANGELIQAEIRSSPLAYEGKPARLVTVRDVTEAFGLLENNTLLASSKLDSRWQGSGSARHFLQLFKALPGKLLLLTPDDFRIVAMSDSYLAATMTRRSDIRGQRLFDVLPDDPEDSSADGSHNLEKSLQNVVKHGIIDIMPVQRYPIRRPDELDSGFEERFWNIVNTPVKNTEAVVVCIIHRIEDVTELVRPSGAVHGALGVVDNNLKNLALDAILHARELQAAHSNLREQEANLRTAQDLLKVATWKFDIKREQLTWTDEIIEMYGAPPGTYQPTLDQHVEMVHPEDRDAMLDVYQSFIQGEKARFEFAHRIVRSDGQIVHVRGVGERTIDQDNSPIITGVVLDVTQRKIDETRMREADLLLQMAGRAARLGAWRVKLDPEEVHWSTQTCEIHEEPPGISLTVETAIQYYAPEYRERITQAFNDCAKYGTAFDEVLQIITAKGTRVWVRCIGEAERDRLGRIFAVRGAFQEISELMQARDEAKQMEARLETTLEEISDAFFTVDKNWNFTFLNNQAESYLQRSRTELLGKNLWEAFPEAVGTSFETRYRTAVESRTTERFTEFFEPLERWFEVNAFPSSDGLAVYFRDVTDLQLLEEQLRRSQKLEALGKLTGGIAHDFNNLVTVIIGNAELLTSKLDDQPELNSLSNMIMQAAESGAELTRRLLAFSRRQALQPRCVNVNQLITQTDSLLRRALGEDVEVEMVQAAGLWLTEIDPTQFESALLNLAINARDAMPNGGRLTIETGNASFDDDYARLNEDVIPGQYVRVSVSDSGCGMPPDVAERAFDPFFTTKPEHSGSGLGLSMVYGFVKQSGGNAKIYTEVGEGTTFNLYFPRSYKEKLSAPELGTPAVLKHGKECILVVEDDELVRKNLVTQLNMMGYRVYSAASGQAALNVLESLGSIDLLLTDVVMPGGMNGRMLADLVTGKQPGVKVLFTSGYTENAIVHGGRLDPGVHLLSKPYRRIDLARKVRKVLDAPVG